MTYRQVLKFPNARLKEISSPVVNFDADLSATVRDLYDTLNVEMGAGIAAPQIGILQRIALIKCSAFDVANPHVSIPDVDDDILVLINPSFDLSEDRKKWDEGCLSVPGFTGTVERSSSLTVSYQDIKGNMHTLDVGWPLAGAVQHECDHLDGILYIDRLPKKEHQRIKRKLFMDFRAELKKKRLELKKNKKTVSGLKKKIKRVKAPKSFGKLKKRKKR